MTATLILATKTFDAFLILYAQCQAIDWLLNAFMIVRHEKQLHWVSIGRKIKFSQHGMNVFKYYYYVKNIKTIITQLHTYV